MKKLVLLIDVAGIGGIQKYNSYLYNTLERKFGKDNLTIVSFGSLRHRARKILLIFKMVVSFFASKPGILICGHTHLAAVAFFVKKLFNVKYIVLTHGIDVWNLRRGVKYRCLKDADLIISVSRYTKNRMVSNGIPESKIKLLQNAVDVSLFRRRTPKKELFEKIKTGNRRVLLTVGRLSSREGYKGHDIMLEVLRLLGDGYLWLVIGGGDDLGRLEKKAAYLGVAEKVRFLGQVSSDELIDYYNLCDCFVMPSSGEGFGIVFLEAMACGKPVIAGNRCGSAEPLMDGKLGFLVNPDNAEEIANAINVAFTAKENRTDPDYLTEEVSANFGVSVFDKKVEGIFSKILP